MRFKFKGEGTALGFCMGVYETFGLIALVEASVTDSYKKLIVDVPGIDERDELEVYAKRCEGEKLA